MRQGYYGKIALLRNVLNFDCLVGRIVSRKAGLPGIGVFYGPGGSGKSFAARFAAAGHSACLVQINSGWTRKFFLKALAEELLLPRPGEKNAASAAELVHYIAGHLACSQRPLFVDGADLAPGQGIMEAVRDIYAVSRSAVIFIGGERLPAMLQQRQGLNGCVLEMMRSLPCDAADCAAMAKIYCGGAELDRAWLTEICAHTEGNAAAMAVLLDRAEAFYERGRPARLDGEQAPPTDKEVLGDWRYSSASTQLRARSTAFCQPL